MKDKIYLITIVSILLVGIIGFIFLKRANNQLIEEQLIEATKLRKKLEKQKDSLITLYSKEIEYFEIENSSLNEINKNLNIRVRNYEKKLPYMDRTFNTAVDILSKARYNSKQ